MSQLMNMSGFTTAVVGLIVGALILMVALQVYPMVVDIGNDIHLMTKNGGVWEVNGKRFDRVAFKTADKTKPEQFDSTDWVTPTGTNVIACPAEATPAGTLILPGGSEVSHPLCASSASTITDGKVASPVRFLQKNTSLISIVVQAVALLLSLAPLGMLGGVGYMFLGRFSTGMSTMSRVITAVIGVVIGGTVLVTFVDFIDIAYSAIDGARFTVFASGLGSLANVITDFWGVLFIISMLVLGGVFSFQGYKSYKGRSGGGDSAMVA